MSAKVISIKKFNEKIRMYIPFHEVSSPPRLGDVEGQTFECGCGESHIMNFEQHYLLQMEVCLRLFFYLQIVVT